MAYDQPKITIVFTYEVGEVVWTHVSPKDRQKFRETIEGYAIHFSGKYEVETDLDGGDFGLTIRFREQSNATERQLMKGEVFALVGDTIWGGGPG
jgi:hypothetical protein